MTTYYIVTSQDVSADCCVLKLKIIKKILAFDAVYTA